MKMGYTVNLMLHLRQKWQSRHFKKKRVFIHVNDEVWSILNHHSAVVRGVEVASRQSV